MNVNLEGLVKLIFKNRPFNENEYFSIWAILEVNRGIYKEAC